MAFLALRVGEDGRRVLGVVELGDARHAGILAHQHRDAGIDVGPGEGDLERSFRIDGRHLDAEVDLAALGVGPARGEALLDELDVSVLAEQILRDEARDIDVESGQFTLFVDEAERRRFTGDADDHVAAGHDLVEHGLLGSEHGGGLHRGEHQQGQRDCRTDQFAEHPGISLVAILARYQRFIA